MTTKRSYSKGSLYSRRDMVRMSIGGLVGAAGLTNTPVLAGEMKSVSQGAPLNADAPIRTRFLWTWDHCMEWALNRPGLQTMGASNSYGRSAETFIDDYTKLFEWCGRHHIDGVVVWGLLRDNHGGIESAKRLCDVANKNGVKLLCGVGLNAYGGVYYEGNSPYSLEKHLMDHPELYGTDEKGNKMAFSFGFYGPRTSHHACPSRRENQDFAVESLQWLFKTLPGLGGVQIESGDTGVCQCNLCKKRRQHPASVLSWEDMALMYPMAVQAIRSVKPDAFIICETYSHPEKQADPVAGFGQGRPDWSDEPLSKFPEGVFVQYAGDKFFKPTNERQWTDAGKVENVHRNSIMRAHFGTYWVGIRGELAIDWIADMVQQSICRGINGTSIFGEVSAFDTGAELNYLALENYGSAANPKADLDIFLKDVAGPLLGGEEAAHDYLKYARYKSDATRVAAALPNIYRRTSNLPPDAARRWTWLANFLSSTVF